jgi:ATP-binding cassette, subfamily B, bacterial
MSARADATGLADLAWPQARAAEALLALARAAGLRPTAASVHELPSSEDALTLSSRLVATAEECGLELEALQTPYAETDALLARGAPALIAVQGFGGELRLAALLRGGPRARLLAPDGRVQRCDVARLRELWCEPHERALAPVLAPVLDASGLQGAARERARRALVAGQLGPLPVGAAWMLRAPPGQSFVQAARRAGLGRLALAVALTGFAASLVGLLSWIPFARGILSGHFEPAWFAAWALLLLAALPLRWLESWWQSLFGVRFGLLLRRRLMAGATRLDPAAMRGEGAGSLLGRVLDSEALEGLLLGGGFVLVGAAIDVALAGFVLARGPSAALALVLFALWIGAALILGVLHFRRSRDQADARLALTHDLVERMHGQRTRVVQEPRERWHLQEDALLDSYLARARALDRTTLTVLVLVSGGWLAAGTAALALAFVDGHATALGLALGLGALLLGQQALARLSSGLVQLAACAVAWRQVRPVYRAATQVESPGLPRSALRPGGAPGGAPGGTRVDAAGSAPSAVARAAPGEDTPLLVARQLSFRHPGREQEALTAIDLTLRRGDRVLLQGPSGGGKSTLVSLLSGWREPRAGSLLLNGLDRASQGAERWRRHVTAAPQFHENHVFTGTFAFNLLLAAPHEPAPDGGVPDEARADDGADEGAEDRAEARALQVCRELGLGPLIARMPSGLRQILGETGWQLSHGERSRLFVARALLADASLVILDESLAALDPETGAEVLACVRRRAPALLVVAHP